MYKRAAMAAQEIEKKGWMNRMKNNETIKTCRSLKVKTHIKAGPGAIDEGGSGGGTSK
jgi:hypothetical protein